MPVPLSLVKIDVADHIATITIDRPEALNSLTFAALHQLQRAFDEVIADPGVDGIVLAGAGKVFIVGADIEFFIRNIEAKDIPRITKFTQTGHRLLNTIDRSPKPVVARVAGAALGGGMETALACDYVVATPGASFGFPETGLGICPGFGGTQRSPRAFGVGIAKWLIYTGKTLSAADAKKIGLVDQIVSPDQLDATCQAFAAGRLTSEKRKSVPEEFAAVAAFFARNRADDLRAGTAAASGDAALVRAMRPVAAKGPLALRVAERLIDQGIQRSFDDGLQLEVDSVPEIFTSQDAYTGLSFRSKRGLGQPVFQGC